METVCTQDSDISPSLLNQPPLPGGNLNLLTETELTQIPHVTFETFRPGSRIRVKRPHTKSRRGCFNCKSRRVKCQETRPACANCMHKDLDCVYPTDRYSNQERRLDVVDRTRTQTQGHSFSQLASSPPSAIPRISATSFTGDDLQFWHHFLVDARPHLPFGDEGTWVSEIPAFAHECPHLLHAILSLGASHCSLIAPRGSQYIPVAIAHRGKALKALSAIVSRGNNTVTDMDAALATCYTLTFQAHHMSDGVVDFAVMVRGCGLVTDWYFQSNDRQSKFFNLKLPEATFDMITSWLPEEPQPLNNPLTVAACLASLQRLQPILQSPAHVAFYTALQLAYESLLISHRDAFRQLTMIYATWTNMNNIEFLSFIAPGNHVSRALFMHYVTVDIFMRPVYLELEQARGLRFGGGHFMLYRWAETVYEGLPAAIQELVRGQFYHMAHYLLPEALYTRELYPKWSAQLEGFISWLRKRLPAEVVKSYNL
ncbi:hypothetical protein BJX61DRAFT_336408 [Aspergillus egyptiacus]|nr:hypothetical protein BJX61DRAFT_336408 [Aspergillus egyptiacus]